MHYVIIGNGIAGIQAAEAIRQLDTDAELTMVAAETEHPYCRPMISMLLAGEIRDERLPVRPVGFYQQHRIQVLTGSRVSQLDPHRRTLRMDNGKHLGFDRLLIATGADPRRLKVPGASLPRIFYMRTADQVRAMLRVLPQVQRALVLGGGLVGFKAAGALLKHGVNVTMLIGSAYPLSQQVDATAGAMILQELQRHGLKVKVHAEVSALEGDTGVEAALLNDGQRLPCDLVIVGKGVLPALSFVPRDAIQVDLGIRVNPYLETSVPGIYAAGDVAETIDIARCKPWINAIWPEAAAQGRIAGYNLTGRRIPYKGSLSRNVMRICDLDVMTAGLVHPDSEPNCEFFERYDARRNTYRKLVVQDNRLVGMVMVNHIEQGGVLTALIQAARPLKVSPASLLDTGFNYACLLQA